MDKTKFNIKFGIFVREKRNDLGWSQSQLSARIGNNYQNISRLERGEISPTLYWCSLLANAFEIDLDELIKEFSLNIKN